MSNMISRQDLDAVAKVYPLESYRTLVLNADYTPFTVLPLSATNWMAAITNMWLGKYDAERVYEGVKIRSQKLSLELPSVVVNKTYRNPDRRIAFSTSNVYLRDDYTCQYCGKKFTGTELTFDHIKPRCLGGKTTWKNIVSSCRKCNSKKGHKTFEGGYTTALGKRGPLHEARKPSYFELSARVKSGKIIIPEGSGWEYYLNWDGPMYVRNRDGETYQISGPDSEPIGKELLGF